MNWTNISKMESVTLKNFQFNLVFILTHEIFTNDTKDTIWDKKKTSNALFSLYRETLAIAKFKQQPCLYMKSDH